MFIYYLVEDPKDSLPESREVRVGPSERQEEG